jgi:hypothetical protein
VAEIAQVKTIPVTDEGGQGTLHTHGIMVAVNTDQAGMDSAFVRQLANTIALHRMCSPPDTSVLVVSVIGPFDSGAFRSHWREALADSSPEMQALRYFLQQMRSAALAHGKRDGTLLESVELRLE